MFMQIRQLTYNKGGFLMTTVAILPVTTSAGDLEYQAVAGARLAVGKSAGQALDALAAE